MRGELKAWVKYDPSEAPGLKLHYTQSHPIQMFDSNIVHNNLRKIHTWPSTFGHAVYQYVHLLVLKLLYCSLIKHCMPFKQILLI